MRARSLTRARMDADVPVNERACTDADGRPTHTAHMWTRCWQQTLTRADARLQHLSIHLNADAGLSPHTDNTHLADSSQLGLGGAPLLSCTESSFHWVRRDKAAWSFFCYTRLKPLECEKSFNAVPLRGERNNLKRDTLHTGSLFSVNGL